MNDSTTNNNHHLIIFLYNFLLVTFLLFPFFFRVRQMGRKRPNRSANR